MFYLVRVHVRQYCICTDSNYVLIQARSLRVQPEVSCAGVNASAGASACCGQVFGY